VSHGHEIDVQDSGLPPLVPLAAAELPAVAPAGRSPVIRTPLSRLIGLLPVIGMALLAGATWWLLRSTPSASDAAAGHPLRHEPDYEMRGFSIWRSTGEGPSHGLLAGDRLRHFPDTRSFEIDAVSLHWIQPGGGATRVNALQARFSDDGQQIDLQGTVKVIRTAAETAGPPGDLVFSGEAMRADAQMQRIEANRPVTLELAGSRLSAEQLSFDHRAGLLVLHGVRGELDPGVRRR
jgi:lipopolysaccharide export system protein LptC